MVVARLMGRLAVKLGQPAVVGEIIAGILLGPPCSARCPATSTPCCSPRTSGRSSTCSPSSGWCCSCSWSGSRWTCRSSAAGSGSPSRCRCRRSCCRSPSGSCWPRSSTAGTTSSTATPVEFLSFALFLGVAMSITAFPVLARILAERNMHRIPTGVLSLACAAVDDVLAWALLAVVVAVVVGGDFTGVLEIIGYSVIFALVMFLVVRPLLKRLVTCRARFGADDAGHDGRRPHRDPGQRVGDRGDRHPLHLRGVRLRRRHAAGGRGAADPRDHRPARAGQRAAPAAGVLRRHRAGRRHRRARPHRPGRARDDPAASRSPASSSAPSAPPGSSGCRADSRPRWACS